MPFFVQNIPVAKPGRQTTGPLVEDGISKEERARFLREQREQRKANRKKGRPDMKNKSKNTDAGPNAPGPDGGENPVPATPRNTIIPQPTAPTVTKREEVREDRTIPAEAAVAPVSEEQKQRRIPSKNGPGSPPEESSSGTDITTRPTVTAPPPRMFNPTTVAPPTAVPPRAVTTVSQAQRHPTMAFSVNETVERALKEAKREASLADRKAMFWLQRFIDLAVLAASFMILSFSSDRSFDDC